MSVFRDKRGNGRWRYSFMWQGKRYNGSCPKQANNERNAERLERLRQEDLVAGKKRASITVAVLAEKFFAFQGGRIGPLTLEMQRSHIDLHVLPVIGKRRVDQIDKEALDTLVTKWLETAAITTVNSRMVTLMRMLKVAAEWNLIAAAPKWKKLKVPEVTPRFLTESEAESLLKAASKTWYPMILVGLRTGLRIGELRGLQWGDVDLGERPSIRVRRTDPGRPDVESNAPKGKRDRTVPLSPDAHACLLEMRPADAKARDYVWPASFYKGKVERDRCRSESGCKHGLRAAVEASGIVETADDRIGWHTLRHTFASWLVIRGVSIRVIQELLGHATVQMTEVYAHLAPDATHHDEVARLDLALVGAARPMLTDGDRE